MTAASYAKIPKSEFAQTDFEELIEMLNLTLAGGEEEAVAELREKVFEGKTVNTLQPSPNGEGMTVVELK